MNSIITLSNLLTEADALHKTADKATIVPTELEQRYLTWYRACTDILPDDLRPRFIYLYEPGTVDKPMISDLFRAFNAPAPHLDPVDADAPVSLGRSWWQHRYLFQYILKEQREQVFYARRRLWLGSSRLPKGMRTAIATVCKNAYRRFGIDDVFLQSGCDPHWHIPPFNPDSAKSERMNAALGWLDGILVYAPEREVSLMEAICETILGKPRLPAKAQSEVETWLTQLQQPAPSALNPLDRYDVHPTVQDVAGKLVADQHYNEAVLKVCIALNEAVQVAIGHPELDGSGLMQQAFAPRAPMLQCSQNTTEQQGWMFLFTGVMMAVRNPRAHHLLDNLSEPEAMEWLLFVSALFRKLDKVKKAS